VTILEAGAKLRARAVSCVELVHRALQRAERGRELNAFITITAEQARIRARELDEELKNGNDRGPLHGIPIAYKDLFYTRGVRSTNGSKIFADFTPDYDATVVTKLEAAGAIPIGKLNQHEMAYGITSSNRTTGQCETRTILSIFRAGPAAARALRSRMERSSAGWARIPAARSAFPPPSAESWG
jgi:aspartyl-tRNA(Asn)/glutamyl-tRNA(Gln) amidotransferase subunit A